MDENCKESFRVYVDLQKEVGDLIQEEKKQQEITEKRKNESSLLKVIFFLFRNFWKSFQVF